MPSNYGEYELHEFVADFYDVEYTNLRTKDVDFYVECAKNTGGRALELGCGTGRVLIPTARAGAAITGLDLSAFMLAKCRENLVKETTEVQNRVKNPD